MKEYSKICLILIAVLTLNGCSSQKEETDSEASVSASGTEQVQTEEKLASGTESAAEAEATPEVQNLLENEPLNIIDDNYRTYYEIFVGSFYDSNGDGIGDIKGILAKLDYLKDPEDETTTDLGVNGIWLMPIMPSPSYHKYDVTDYYNIDPQYGTIEDFKELIKECDQRGIKIIIDLVLNHTSSQHPWFTEATSYLKKLKKGQEIDLTECPYAGYYNFSKDAAKKTGWCQLEGTEWYYEARFSSNMPDLNLDSDYVRERIQKVASYWMDLGVGGFRLDAAKEYYTGNGKKNIEFLNWFQTYVKSQNPECYVVAEVWDSIGTISQYYESGIDSIFNYYYGSSDGKIANLVNQISKGKAGKSLAKVMKSMQDTLSVRNPSYIDASFLSNHDNDRCISYVGTDLNKMKLMAGINLCMSGSSFVYYGEEIGMAGSGKDENKRGPMIWSNTNTEGKTTGPVNMDTFADSVDSVEDQQKDPYSLLNYYIKAIRLRNTNPEIARGTIDNVEGIEDGDLCVIQKTFEGSTITILYNMSDVEKELDLSTLKIDYDKLQGALLVDDQMPVLQNGRLGLPSYSILVLK